MVTVMLTDGNKSWTVEFTNAHSFYIANDGSLYLNNDVTDEIETVVISSTKFIYAASEGNGLTSSSSSE